MTVVETNSAAHSFTKHNFLRIVADRLLKRNQTLSMKYKIYERNVSVIANGLGLRKNSHIEDYKPYIRHGTKSID